MFDGITLGRDWEKTILERERQANKNICWICKKKHKEGDYRKIRWPKPVWSKANEEFVVRFEIFFCKRCLKLSFDEIKKKWRKSMNEQFDARWVKRALENSVCEWTFF